MFEDIQSKFDTIDKNHELLKKEIDDVRKDVANITERWLRASTIAKLFDMSLYTVNVIANNPESKIRVVKAATTIDTGRMVVRINYDDFNKFMVRGGIKSAKVARRYGLI